MVLIGENDEDSRCRVSFQRGVSGIESNAQDVRRGIDGRQSCANGQRVR